MTKEVHQLLIRAAQAAASAAAPPASTTSSAASTSEGAAAAKPGADGPEARRQRAREAASRVLREGLAAMAPEARSLVRRAADTATSPALPELQAYQGSGDTLVTDLFSLARSLETSDDGV